jgi:5-methylcytosine-specific restriction protein B
MNTIDRSVDSFDLALRRRFYWEKMGPDLTTLKYHLKNKSRAWVPITDNLENLNKAITAHELLGEDYQIGQAYLMNLGYPSHLSLSDLRANIWEDSIQPLLEEYLRGSGRSNDILNDFKKAFSVQ